MRQSERLPFLARQVQIDRDLDLLGIYPVDTGHDFQVFLAAASAWLSDAIVDMAMCVIFAAFMFLMGVRLDDKLRRWERGLHWRKMKPEEPVTPRLS
jgi:hypothetical protein